MIKEKFLLTTNYKVLKKISDDKIKTVYLLKSKDTNEKFIAKQFYINDMDQYLEFENLLASLLDLTVSEPQGLTPLVEYHSRNVSEDKNELILIFKKYECSLSDQISILGNKIMLNDDNIFSIFKDLCFSVKSVHEKNLLYLALNPRNVLYTSQGKYLINDVVFNHVSMKLIKSEEIQLMNQRLKKFPEFHGKKEHNICIFDGTYDTQTETVVIMNKDKQKTKITPYEAPEIIQNGFNPTTYSDLLTKADVFSLGMMYMRLICYVKDENFSQIACLNRAKDEESHNKILCKAINILEKYDYKEEGQFLVQMLMRDPQERIHIDKIIPLLKIEQQLEETAGNKTYKNQSYKFQKFITPKCGYLKPNVIRGHLQINSMKDMIKFVRSRDEKIQKLSLFFSNEHLKDSEVKEVAKYITNLDNIETLVADFGNYPLITDLGFSYFIDSISKFDIQSLSISLGTTVNSRSVNISDSMIKYLASYLKKLQNLKIFKLNLRNRISISSESLFSLREVLENKLGLKKIDLLLDGTLADPILCRKFEAKMKEKGVNVLFSY